MKLGLSEKIYTQMPLGERARKLVTMKLPEWMQILEADRQHKEWQAKNQRVRR